MSFETGFLEAALDEDRVTTVGDTLASHATDWGTENGTEPGVVVYPTDTVGCKPMVYFGIPGCRIGPRSYSRQYETAEVADVLATAHERSVPVTPYAAGTSLEGNPVPVEGGISMDLTRMDEILEVRPEDLRMDVQPGVMGSALGPAAGTHGLFFPPLPSSGDISTVGGMVANAASGMQTVRYGEIADWVLALEVVLADRSVITAGSRAVKSSSGYNLR